MSHIITIPKFTQSAVVYSLVKTYNIIIMYVLKINAYDLVVWAVVNVNILKY